MFELLPQSLMHYPMATWIAGMFYICLLSASLTSTVSLIEPWITLVQARKQVSRLTVSLSVTAAAFLLAVPAIYSLCEPGSFVVNQKSFFTMLTAVSTEYMLPLGALGLTIAAGWLLPKSAWQKAFKSSFGLTLCRGLCRTAGPLAVLISLWGSWL